MAAPQFVPVPPTHRPRSYASPPWRELRWTTDRPGDHGPEGQPEVDAGAMGAPGPDQGYMLTLAPLLRDEVHLAEGEIWEDAERGCVAVGLKRASAFGRAPILDDLRVAFTIWGFLDPQPPKELVELRREMFEGLRHTQAHYPELRRLADTVPVEALRGSVTEVEEAHRGDWRGQLTL